MDRYTFISWTTIGLCCISCTNEKKDIQKVKSKLPNIVFIYTDDMGYGDAGCYGANSIQTPNIDNMAEEGIRFTNFYSCSPVSSPSRAGLLTGRYPVRQGITRVFFPNSLQGIDSSEVTIAELLKQQGYATGIIGKWHLGHLPEFLPIEHGFDYWFGLPYSNDMEWEPRNDPPLPLYRQQHIIDQPTYQNTLTQRYTIEAQNFIAKHQDEPFFLYLAHTFPHTPLHVSEEFEDTSPTLYGDVIQELDKSVGEVLKTLRTFGLDSNTLIVFSSDNGPAPGFNAPPQKGHGSPGNLRGWKATTFEGGIKVPTLARWKGKIKPNQVIETPCIMMDWFCTFANLANTTIPNDRPIDGKDLSGLLFNNGSREEAEFYFYFNEELRAMRSGDWKYKKAFEGSRKWKPHEAMLFNLNKDPNETNNLIDQYPELADSLKKKMQTFIKELGDIPEPKVRAIPFDDPRKDKKPNPRPRQSL